MKITIHDSQPDGLSVEISELCFDTLEQAYAFLKIIEQAYRRRDMEGE